MAKSYGTGRGSAMPVPDCQSWGVNDGQPYLINQTLIDMIRATAQDESIKLVEPEVDEEVGED